MTCELSVSIYESEEGIERRFARQALHDRGVPPDRHRPSAGLVEPAGDADVAPVLLSLRTIGDAVWFCPSARSARYGSTGSGCGLSRPPGRQRSGWRPLWTEDGCCRVLSTSIRIRERRVRMTGLTRRCCGGICWNTGCGCAVGSDAGYCGADAWLGGHRGRVAARPIGGAVVGDAWTFFSGAGRDAAEHELAGAAVEEATASSGWCKVILAPRLARHDRQRASGARSGRHGPRRDGHLPLWHRCHRILMAAAGGDANGGSARGRLMGGTGLAGAAGPD